MIRKKAIKMTKNEINNGAIVVLRDGTSYIKIDKTLLSLKMDGDFIYLDSYNDSLDFETIDGSKCSFLDIMEIFNDTDNKFGACSKALDYYINFAEGCTWRRQYDQEN